MGNVIIIIGLVIAAGVMFWQFLVANPPESDSSEGDWQDDVDNTEDSLDETEEFLRRMERLSKRTTHKKEDDDKK